MNESSTEVAKKGQLVDEDDELDDYENEEEQGNLDEDDEDDLEDNLIDAEELNKYKRLQLASDKEARSKAKSESAQLLGESLSQESLANENESETRSEKLDADQVPGKPSEAK